MIYKKNENLSTEFYKYIIDLLITPEFNNLAYYHAHSLNRNKGNREYHCIRVSYLVYRFAKQLNELMNYLSSKIGLTTHQYLDPRKFARAGALHDIGTVPNGYGHEKISADIAKKYGENEETQEAIRTHMFLFYNLETPKSFLGWAVWFFDKLDCLIEIIDLSPYFDELLIERLYDREK